MTFTLLQLCFCIYVVKIGDLKLPLSKPSLGYARNLKIWYVSTDTYLVLETLPFSTRTPLILLMAAPLFCKKSAFFGKNSAFTHSNNESIRE